MRAFSKDLLEPYNSKFRTTLAESVDAIEKLPADVGKINDIFELLSCAFFLKGGIKAESLVGLFNKYAELKVPPPSAEEHRRLLRNLITNTGALGDEAAVQGLRKIFFESDQAHAFPTFLFMALANSDKKNVASYLERMFSLVDLKKEADQKSVRSALGMAERHYGIVFGPEVLDQVSPETAESIRVLLH